MAGRYGRGFVNQAFDRADQKNKAETARRKAGAPARVKVIRTAPVVGDPEAVDWDTCGCGYQRAVENGKPMPQTREPAWQWTEEPSRGGKADLKTAVKNLAVAVYGLGYFRSGIELLDYGGFPDNLFWGPKPPNLLVRELKAMRHTWQPGQKQHLLSMRERGLDTGVWKPCCLLSGRIDDELAALAGKTPSGAYARTHRQAGSGLTWGQVAAGALGRPNA